MSKYTLLQAISDPVKTLVVQVFKFFYFKLNLI